MEQKKPSEQVSMMLKGIMEAKGEALGCDDCFELLDHCADLMNSGHPYEEVYPHVKKHLDDCVCCFGEFESLMAAVRAAAPSDNS